MNGEAFGIFCHTCRIFATPAGFLEKTGTVSMKMQQLHGVRQAAAAVDPRRDGHWLC
jgi:hypothetical protein